MPNEPQIVHVAKVERKRNPLGIVLCVAFLLVAMTFLIKQKQHGLTEFVLFTAIGLPFLLVKETR